MWHGRGDEGEEVRECGTGEGQGEKDGRYGERGECGRDEERAGEGVVARNECINEYIH